MGGMNDRSAGARFMRTHVLEYPYTRTLGPVLGPFLTALRNGRILGIRCGGRVLCPPVEYDPETAAPLEPDFVEVGPGGVVETWTWISEPTRKHPLGEPFAFASIKLDGADTAMIHAVKASSRAAMATGMRVRAQFRSERTGAITDVYFVPEDEAVEQEIEPASDEVKITTHLISLAYTEPLYPHLARYAQGLLEGKFIGQKSPADGRVYIPGKGYDPLARVRMGPEDDIELPPVGTVVSYTVASPLEYMGQTETENYISAVILLDGANQPLVQQTIRDIPLEEFRVGMRLRAVLRPPEQRSVDDVDNNWMICSLGNVVERWEPTGEPDVRLEDLPEHL
ncbi:MAG: hypothetical protein D6760_04795 [Deltaproteobacteria bacterium]|nr:MAG: hypothetical protein D6760_04795 [Deltaproteobacteria bacterium]